MTEMLPDVVTRKSVPLTQRDLDDIAKLFAGEATREALSSLAHTRLTERASEATVLHAFVTAGLRAVQDRINEDGYAEWAADTAWWEEERRIRDSRIRRQQQDWADKE